MSRTQSASWPALGAELVERLIPRVVSSGGSAVIDAPFTGETLAKVPISTADDVRKAYRQARAAQRAWSALSPARRAEPFLRLHDTLLDRREEILDIIQWVTGKARRHALEEVFDVAGCALYYARHAPKLLAAKRRRGAIVGATLAHELRQPKGVVGVITPWNYPFTLALSDVIPALLAGNAVVHKPDTQTALSVLWGHDLLTELGMPAEIWQIVLGEPAEIGSPLLDEADYVAFTGSTRAGKAIAERLASRLVGYSLELGGKNPMVVLDDADLDKAATGAVQACFTNAGQLCLSAERLYVHENVRDAFLERFLARVNDMRLGAGFDFTPDMGSLTYRHQLDTVRRHVEQAREKGAQVLAGGRTRPDLGPLFYEPTVLASVPEDAEVCRNETFGPVVSVYPVATDEEAIARANNSWYGLNASVWTADLARGRRVAARIQAGCVDINEAYRSTYGSYDAPMGGMKQSGLGRRHGAEGLLKYTEAQTVAAQRWIDFEPPQNMSLDRYAAVMAGAMKIARRLRLR